MKKHPYLILLLALLLGGCISRNNGRAIPASADSTITQVVVGADRDEHGCIRSAGYCWSEVRQACIRPFEEGIRMVSATDPEATSCAYLVFSADSARAELFLPDTEASAVLDRRPLSQGGSAWNVEDDDTYNVRFVEDRWRIERRARTLYLQEIK